MTHSLFRIDYGPAFRAAQLERRTLSVPAALRAFDGRSILFMTDLHVSRMFPEAALRRRAKTARVDGFRKGHVPMNMIRAMYGQEAEIDAINQLINLIVDKKIAEGKFRIAGMPSVEPAEGVTGYEPKFVA